MRVKHGRWRALASALLAAALVACGDEAPPPGTLVVALESAPQSLDPRFGIDAGASRLADLVHAGLTRTDAGGRRRGDLAARWWQADARTLVFRLRPGRRFGDGTPVTAEDVRATYAALLDPALASPRRAALAPLAAVEAPDAQTVVLRLRRPFPPILDATGIAVVPARQARGAAVPLGAGPYRIRDAHARERIELEPNPYWRGRPPRLARIVLRVVPDPLMRVLELRHGTIGFLQEAVEPEILAWLRAQEALRVRRRPGTSVAYLALNLRDPRLADRRVRRALALALDREELIRSVLGGAARPATGLLAPGHWAYAPTPLTIARRRRARRLLDRAGHPDPDGPGPRPRFTIIYEASSQPGRRRLAEAIAAQLALVGIGVDIRTYEWGVLFAHVRSGDFQVAALSWVGITEPDHLYLTLHSSMTPPDGYNRGGYRSAVMDRLVTRARFARGRRARRRWYARVQRLAARDLPVIPLWWEDRIVVHTRALHGFTPAPSGELRGLARARLE